MFLHRLGSTVVLLGLLAGMIFAPALWRTVVFYLVSIIMAALLVREVSLALKNGGVNTNEKTLPHIAALCMIFLGIILCPFPNAIAGLVFFYIVLSVMILIGTVITILKILFAVNDPEKIKTTLYSVMILVCLLTPICVIQFIYDYGNGIAAESNGKYNLVFLFFILMTKIGDIGAYVTGTLSNRILKGGNHKMVPSISPGKSWEGMAGGLIITILFGILFVRLAGWVYPLWAVVLAGVIFFFAGMAGDLAESSFKRAMKIKDSGHLIPGIGGIFDLVDSPFLTAPFFVVIILSATIMK